jgi:hypothetical protein
MADSCLSQAFLCLALPPKSETYSLFLYTLQSNPPQPSDEEVFIESRAALEVYVSSFGGWATGSSYLTQAAELTEVCELVSRVSD